MSRVKITLYGLSKYGDLFKNAIFPDELERKKTIDAILLECAEFEPLYADFEYMQFAIKVWSETYYDSFKRIILALSQEYNPIENYDRKEDWSDTGTAFENTETDTKTNKSAFNASDYSPVTETKGKNGAETTGTAVHSGRVHGNIGVTTNVQMLIQDTDFWSTHSITDYIIMSFKEHLILGVYE